MFNYFDTDWKKQAAMTATSDADIEKAFADQAAGFVENKLPDLMRGGHNIGFEIVKKNDDNTRMVGIFAFKVEKSLLFAPVFFLNGEIKGPLIYRTDTKSFLPATKEWAAYLVSSLERREGKGVERSRRSDLAPLVQMERINMAPGMGKKASEECKCCDYPVCNAPVDVVESKDVVEDSQGDCTVVLDKKKKLTKATKNNRLPGNQSTLKMAAAEDGTIRCSIDGQEEFPMFANDAPLFDGEIKTASIALTLPEGYAIISAKDAEQIKQAFFSGVTRKEASWDQVEEVLSWPMKREGILKDLFEQPDYGKAAADLVIKAASASEEFTESLLECYDSPKEMIPEQFSFTEKSASTTGEFGFVNDVKVFAKYATPVPQEFFRDGFFFYDTRPQEELSLVQRENPSMVSVPQGVGMYSVVKEDGDFENNLIGGEFNEECFVSEDPDEIREPEYFMRSSADNPTKYAFIKDGKMTVCKSPLAVYTGSISNAPNVHDTVEKGNAYCAVVGKSIYRPFYVYDVTTDDEVKHVRVMNFEGSSWGNKWNLYNYKSDADFQDDSSYSAKFTINPNVKDSNLSKGIIGTDVKFIKVNVSKRKPHSFSLHDALIVDSLDSKFGSKDTVDAFIFSRFSSPHVKITRSGSGYKTKYQFSVGDSKSDLFSKKSAMMKLAADMGIYGPEVYDILKEADAKGQMDFYLQPMTKRAMRLRLVESPMFQDEFDSDQGITIQPVQKFRLNMHGDQEFEPASSIGDMLNPTSATGLPDATVVTTNPEELRELADTYKLPNVFEHGVVGTLANAFNAISLVDRYVAKLEDGVDALGRIKFLIHWSPRDFEKAYGIDDLVNLEARIDANFISLGDVLLDLLKKTERYRSGESPDDKSKDHE